MSKLIPKVFRMAAQGFNPDYLQQLVIQLENTHEKINEHAAKNIECKGMGATLTLAWFTPENLYLAHAGDSRIYLHRHGETTQLNVDHTYAWKKFKRGEITEREFRNHPRRSALYEVIGAGHRNVRPMVAAIPYQQGDRFMICSDGLIDGLWEKHIHSSFIKTNNCQDLKQTLLMRAIENDGFDDMTLVALELK